MPFDSFAADMNIIDGSILLHPVSLGIWQGYIAGTVEIEPLNGEQFSPGPISPYSGPISDAC